MCGCGTESYVSDSGSGAPGVNKVRPLPGVIALAGEGEKATTCVDQYEIMWVRMQRSAKSLAMHGNVLYLMETWAVWLGPLSK